MLAIGASTGGPRALQALVPALPADLGVPIVIVQHMPPGFTASLARRLEQTSPFTVREAGGRRPAPARLILVAPGGHHLEFDAGGVARLTDEPPIHGVRPAVDITLASLAHLYGAAPDGRAADRHGQDGARGLKTDLGPGRADAGRGRDHLRRLRNAQSRRSNWAASAACCRCRRSPRRLHARFCARMTETETRNTMITTDMSQYLDVFLDEGREQLVLLETNILEMERGNHTPEMLQVLFRAAHTLKGSSRAMGFLAIGDLTHEMENILDDLRQDQLAVSTPIVNALLDCLDALTRLVDAVAAVGTDAGRRTKTSPALVARLACPADRGGRTVSPSAVRLPKRAEVRQRRRKTFPWPTTSRPASTPPWKPD